MSKLSNREKIEALLNYCRNRACHECPLEYEPLCINLSELLPETVDKFYDIVFGNDNALKVMLDEGAKMPTRAHETDAGLDLYSREKQIVPAKESAVFDTGVHIELAPGTVGMLKSKSGLNVKHGLISEGVIDAGYTGTIKVKLYNLSGYDYTVEKGDKISQLVIMPILTPELRAVDFLENTERGDGGFGSTGR